MKLYTITQASDILGMEKSRIADMVLRKLITFEDYIVDIEKIREIGRIKQNYITTEEVGKILHRGKARIYRYGQEGTLKQFYIPTGGKEEYVILYSRKEVESKISELCVPEDFISTALAAKKYKVSGVTIMQWARKGNIPFVMEGNAYYLDRVKLEEYYRYKTEKPYKKHDVVWVRMAEDQKAACEKIASKTRKSLAHIIRELIDVGMKHYEEQC